MAKADTMATIEQIVLGDERNDKASEVIKMMADYFSGSELEGFLEHVKEEYGISDEEEE